MRHALCSLRYKIQYREAQPPEPKRPTILNKTKKRLDLLLVDKGLAPSRQRARALIMAGKILVNSLPAAKAGTLISEDDSIELKGGDIPYVSRGGLKLEGALDEISLNITDCTCLDVGASTGGFTDCLLQNGAARVYAVDVGYGQLVWKLRQDPRVVAIERTNIRHMPFELIPEAVDIVTIDVSFISLKMVWPVILPVLKPQGYLVALIKPQFEVGRGQVGRGGIVRDEKLRQTVKDQFKEYANSLSLDLIGLIDSPVLGKKGNREILMGLQKQ